MNALRVSFWGPPRPPAGLHFSAWLMGAAIGAARCFRNLLLLCLALLSAVGEAMPADWTTPLAPFRISGELYYVGSRDLAAYLVVTSQGNILINANLASSPPQIRASVEKLGFAWADTRILLDSQAHFDHVAGAAAILQQTGAQQMAMAGDAEVIESGGAGDFDPTVPQFPPSRVDRILHDGDTVSLGGVTLTAHLTAGHTRGCTTWTLRTHEAGQQFDVVIVGGWAPNPGVRLLPAQGKPAAYPAIVADFERSFATFRALPCDIFLGAHGLYFDLLDKLARLPREGPAVWRDASGYQAAVVAQEQRYREELARQAR